MLNLYKKKILLHSSSFNYKINNPNFNNDVIQISKNPYNIYIYLERECRDTLFHAKKIIIINNIFL